MQLVPASQLHHLAYQEKPTEKLSNDNSPQTKHGLLFPLAYPLKDKNDRQVGDHFMFDGRHWYVGARDELVTAFNRPNP